MRILYFLILLLLISCSSEPKIVITKKFISNKYWDNYNNAIQVNRMRVKKDSTLNVSASDFDTNTGWSLFHKLEMDSTSFFGYNGLNFKKDKPLLTGKVFFDRDNGFEWYTAKGNKKTVGELENETWYLISGLKTEPYEIIIYVDKNEQLHRFNKLASNF